MKTRSQQGVISTIVLIIVAIIILGYFHISLKSIVTTPQVQENLKYAWDLFITGLMRGIVFIQSYFNR
jgi:hypothetical protein